MHSRTTMRPQCAKEIDDEDDDVSLTESEVQDSNVRRLIRNELRNIQSEAMQHRTELVSGEADELNKKLEETNKVFENVNNPREGAIDAQVISTIAQLGKEKAHMFASDLTNFKSIEFTGKLLTFVGGVGTEDDDELPRISREGWIALGQGCLQYMKRSPTLHFLCGSFARDPLKKKEINRTVRPKDKDTLKAATAPRQLQSFQDMDKKEATTVEVERIYGILKDEYKKNGRQPLCYFEFITNPQSFGQTVENMFYTSFLVRDGYCKIQLDRDKLPTIEPVERVDSDTMISELHQHQVIMSITKQEWQDIVNTFEIEKPLIKTRERIQTDGFRLQPSSSNKSRYQTVSDAIGPSTSSQGSRTVLPLKKAGPRQPVTRDSEDDSE